MPSSRREELAADTYLCSLMMWGQPRLRPLNSHRDNFTLAADSFW